ncbi:apolipoprotein N-acyltransferase [Pseudoxanthobacter sp.]|uniref:apolipoprotein N-acyltransferase n=1 Tax=Pseudoxanthobacter sp. TaxID=1925742 RepID=UPI002FE211EB
MAAEGGAGRAPSPFLCGARGTARGLDRLAARLAALTGLRRLGAAFAGGALCALAMPPFGFFPALLVSLPVLVFLIDGASRLPSRGARLKSAAAAGWAWGFGAFLAGLWWIGAAFLVDAEAYGWVMPAAVAGLPAGLGLFPALASAAAVLMWRRGTVRIAVLAACLAGSEWLRGHVATGFPWNDLGYALTSGPLLMQSASAIGVSGLGLVAALAGAAPAAAFGPLGRRPGGLGFVAAMALVLAGLAVFGAVRLMGATPQDVPGVRLRLVQPAIDQSQKWRPEQRWQIFDTLLRLTRGSDGDSVPFDGTTVVVWPETATPFLFAGSDIALREAAAALPKGGVLVAGTVVADEAAGTDPDAPPVRYYNSALVLDSSGTVIGRDDKIHLVPFGEYLPLEPLLGRLGLSALAEMMPGGFTAGTQRRKLTVADVPPFSVLICYEAIFADEVIGPAGRPAWLLNLTNDAWFGDTPGPVQHFHQARARAVEQGLPMVRAANTGISAIVDSYGRVRASLGLMQQGTVDGPLPVALAPTIYARFGELPFALGLIGCLVWRASSRRGDQLYVTD